MTSTTFKLTFGKTKLKTFLCHLSDVVNAAYNDPMYIGEGTSQEWKLTWKHWSKRGLSTADTRNKLVQILFDGNMKNTKVSEIMLHIIQNLQQSLPPVLKYFDFKQNSDDPEVWMVTVRPYSSITQESTEEQWTTVPLTSSQNQASQINETENKNSTTAVKSEESRDSNPYTALPDTNKQADEDELLDVEHVQALSSTSSGISFDSEDIGISKHFTSEIKQCKNFEITEEEIKQVCHDIVTKNENADNELMIKWIMSTACSMDTQMLYQHQLIHDHEVKLLELEPELQNIKQEQTNMMSNMSTKLAKPVLAIMDSLKIRLVRWKQE